MAKREAEMESGTIASTTMDPGEWKNAQGMCRIRGRDTTITLCKQVWELALDKCLLLFVKEMVLFAIEFT